MITITNDLLKVSIKRHGAELVSAIEVVSGKERMWSGSDKYWGKVSPILFPIVGRVKDNYTFIDGQKYELTQHGFLRDQDFEVETLEGDSVTFVYRSEGKHLEAYPYEFEVRVGYVLKEGTLNVNWDVLNLSDNTMYYSIGGHPAFAISQEDNYSFELIGNKESSLITINEGHVDKEIPVTTPVQVDITYDALKNDAIIYSNIDTVILTNSDKSECIEVKCEGFDYVGLWANTKHGHLPPFVCIEPWLGITDDLTSNHQFTQKRGIRELESQRQESTGYSIKYL